MTHQPYTWLEISKSSFDHNISQLKKIAHNKYLAPVIKANAYGHGLLEIGRLCEQNNDVNFLLTTLLSDALLLRQHGITKPIVVWGCFDTNLEQIIDQSIELVVSDLETVQHLNTLGKHYNYKIPIHIKIDTGMSRFGMLPENVLSYIKQVQQLAHIRISGLCTHFSESNNADQAFTKQQYRLFNAVLAQLHHNNIHIPYIHAANSAGIMPTVNECNFFRIGLSTYGYWSSPFHKQSIQQLFPDIKLHPIMTWKTRIMQVKNIAADSYIGYDRTYKTSIPMQLAMLPIGYFDGYDPRFSNKAQVLIQKNNSHYYAPVIGRVCMNVTMIDVSHVPTIAPHDEVILLGDYPQVNANDLCIFLHDPNARKLTTGINHILKRFIVD